MASIMTGIELQDRFSSVLYGIIDTVNIAMGSMYDMSEAMSADIDTSSLQAARDKIIEATAALDRMNATMETPYVPQTPAVPQVEMPAVQWQSVNTDVFANTGVERFQQEVQRVNAELEQLSSVQNEIAKQAYHTMIFPSDMAMDLNSLSVRMDNLREKIQAVENNKINIGTDVANAQLEKMHVQLSQMVQQQNNLNSAMERMDISAANTAYIQLQQTISNTEQFIRDNTNEQGRFNQEIRAGTTSADGLIGAIKSMAAAYISIQAIVQGAKAAFNASDEIVQTRSRLDMMNDGVQSTQELLNMVYVSAQDARGSFSDMASVVARFGNNAKDAFGSSAEVAEFANLVQKQMTIAGASTQEAANAELQLSQALGSGVLRGDEFNSIFEQAPNLIQNIADYLDVPIGQIREMAADGELSADVVKAAIFSAADDINSKFESMPMTWGQIWQSMQNTALMAFQPVLDRLNEIGNSEAFQTGMNGAIETMAVLANIVLNIFDLMGAVGGFIADNWSIIGPIVYGVAAALAVYYGWQMLCAAATGVMSVAQGILNAIMSANPIMIVVLAVIGLIAIFYAAVAAVNKFAGTSYSAMGLICGAISAAVAFVNNIITGLTNFIIGIGVSLWNLIVNFANSCALIFIDPVASIEVLFLNLFNFIVEVVQAAASLLDTLFGSNLADAVGGFQDKVQAKIDSVIEENGGYKVLETKEASVYMNEIQNKRDEVDTRFKLGQGIVHKISNFYLSAFLGSTNIPNPNDYASSFNSSGSLGNIAGNTGDIAGNTGSLDDIAGNTGNTAEDTARIADAVDITDDDLKYLRDIAERDIIDRTVFTKVEVNMGGVTNQVNNMSDLDDIADRLNGVLQEQIMISAEG